MNNNRSFASSPRPALTVGIHYKIHPIVVKKTKNLIPSLGSRLWIIPVVEGVMPTLAWACSNAFRNRILIRALPLCLPYYTPPRPFLHLNLAKNCDLGKYSYRNLSTFRWVACSSTLEHGSSYQDSLTASYLNFIPFGLSGSFCSRGATRLTLTQLSIFCTIFG